jgi:hypothetical protein
VGEKERGGFNRYDSSRNGSRNMHVVLVTGG